MSEPISAESIARLRQWLKYRVASTSDGKPHDIEATIIALLDRHTASA